MGNIKEITEFRDPIGVSDDRTGWDKLKAKSKYGLSNLGDSFKDGFAGAQPLGLAGIEEAPKVIGALTQDVSQAETKQQAGSMGDAKTLQLASSGAKIGMLAGGPAGAAGGLFLGATIGQALKIGDQKAFNDVQDEKSKKEWLQEEEDRLRSWYDQNDSEAIAARIELGKRQNGLIG